MMQELVQSIKNTARDTVNGIHTAIPAKIVSFDSESNRATVQPLAKFYKKNGESIEYPQIHGVPILMPCVGDIQIAFPVKTGDGCLLIFCEESLDSWLYEQDIGNSTKFDLSNAVAIPGLYNTGSSVLVEACNDNAIVMKSGTTKLKVSNSGVKIDGNLTVNGYLSYRNSD